MKQNITLFITTFLILVLFIKCKSPDDTSNFNKVNKNGLHKLEYNNPDLLVDLDVGFKSVPMPMDFDGDGDFDLLISESGAYAESGIFYFENINGNVEMPVFRRGMKVSFERRRLGIDGKAFEVSNVDGQVHVITPDNVGERLIIYKNVPQNVFWDDNEIRLPDKGYDYLHFYQNTQWKMIDFDGDGIKDLICAAFTKNSPNLRGSGALERKKAYLGLQKYNQLVFFRNSKDNTNPIFDNPIEIVKENGESLCKNLSVKPMLADFDNDGDYDFIGMGKANAAKQSEEWEDNYYIYYENTGTKSNYKFATRKVLMHDKIPIQMESRATILTTAIDWDKDGYIDIIAGDEGGRVAFLKNTGKIIDGVPQFLPPRNFQQEAKYVDFGALTAPRVFDWDGDGLDDIISGNGLGHIGFIKNLGGSIPKWDAPKLLKVDGIPIRVIESKALPNTEEPKWGYTTIDVADWNHNGLPDILVNHHNGNVLWYENIGTRTEPKLNHPKPIEVEWKGEPTKPSWVPGESKGNELLAQWRTSPLVKDFNNDGLNDLVMLDYEGYLAVYMRYKGGDGKLLLSPPQRKFVFPTGEPILLNQRTGSSSGRLKITFADWDGDGLEDLIFSSKPAVDWMKNLGMKDGKIVLQYMGRVISRTLMGHTDGPVVSDFNKDGIPDLLVGTETGVFYYWERSSFDITTTMTTTGKQTPANYSYFKR